MEVTHIIHIADLHIRTGDPDRARIEEYTKVFEQFIEDIRKLECVKKKSAITVIAGDVFHNKGRIESAGFQMFSRFLNALSRLTPVVFICGNHDFRQEDLRIPDMLDSMLDPWIEGNDRITYLRETGIYQIGNVGLGVVSVKDALASGNTTGPARVMPTFPSAALFPADVKHRLALFHGTIRASKLQNGLDANSVAAIGGSGVSLEWFKGYDGIILGDVHKQQIGRTNEGVHWGYPGSLIQQDFGESVLGHGYLLWKLNGGATTVTAHHVKNPYGMISMRNKEDVLYVNMGLRKWMQLEECYQDLPKNPSIRVHGMSPTYCIQTLCDFDIQPKTVQSWLGTNDEKETETDNESENIQSDLEQLSSISTVEKWMEYIQFVAPELMKYTNEWFSSPEKMNILLPKDEVGIASAIVQKIQDRMNKVIKSLHVYKDALGSVFENQRNKIRLKQVAWDYTLCYGLGNVFDFDSITKNIALLNGRNAMGKSSFLEMLCLGLFGESTKSRVNAGKKMSAKVIHNKKPQNKKAMNIRVRFDINEIDYEIVREFGVQGDKTNVSQFGVELCEIVVGDDGLLRRKMLREGTSAVNAWMEKNIGSIESILLSNFITQIDQHNFFTLRQEEQKQLLERALHLEAVTAFGDLIHEARLGHSYVIGQMNAVVETSQNIHTSEAVESPDTLAERLAKLEQDYTEMCKERNELHNVIRKDFVFDVNIDYEEMHTKHSVLLDKIGDITEADRRVTYEKRGARLQEIKRLQDALLSVNADCDEAEDEEIDYDAALEYFEDASSKLAECDAKRPAVSSEYTYEMLVRMKKQIRESSNSETKPKNIKILQKHVTTLQETITKPVGKKPVLPESSVENEHDWLTIYVETKQQLDEMSAKPLSIEKNMEEYLEWKKKYAQWRKKYQDVMIDETTVDDYKLELIQHRKELDSMIQSQDEKKSLLMSVQEIGEELEKYQNIPFNPECWACASQSWRKLYEEKSTRLQNIRTKIGTIEKKLNGYQDNIQEKSEKIKELEGWIDWKQKYEKELATWETQLSYWTDWKKRWNEYDEWRTTREQLTEEWTIASWILWDEFQEGTAMLLKWTKIQEMQTIVNENWDNVKAMYEWQRERNVYLNETKIWKNRVDRFEWMHQLQDAEDQLAIDEKRCARIAEWEKQNHLLEIAISGCAMAKLNRLNDEFVELEKLVKQTRMAYGHSQNQYDKYKKNVEKYMLQKEYLDMLQSREKTLLELEKWFNGNSTTTEGDSGGYKHWIYTTKVIPMLQRELNKCLSAVENLRMKIDYEKGGFIYYVEDGERQPSLDKASGYQNFIISLCMRITLGRLGATRNDLRQLIIDEGFTSCDADNLGKMPEFLMGLLRAGDFDSILLMSHLEGIRDSTTQRIDIRQEGCYSKIAFGEPYQVLPKVEDAVSGDATTIIKKRGRPKKQVEEI